MIKRILFIIILCASLLVARTTEEMLNKINLYEGTKTVSNISNWSCWFYDNGMSAHSPDGSSGANYPLGTAATIYQDGFMWGGKVDTDGDGMGDRIRVGGQQYNVGTVPGWVISGGDDGEEVVADPDDPAVRIYRIRSDYQNMSELELKEDAAMLNETYSGLVSDDMMQAVLEQYQKDWEEWPVDRGAPFIDIDQDGIYTAGIDEPGMANAVQVIWFVVNDYDRSKTVALHGSEPIGIELQVTIWAYDDPDFRFGQSIFKSYKMINKSNATVEDMYITQWSDPDVGSASDDLVGCDTIIGMGYAYNGDRTDWEYDVFDLVPPAAGYVLLQGPMVASSGDTARFEFNDVLDHKNLPMTSFGWFAAGSSIDDPDLGDYIGTLQLYNMMRGYKPTEDIDNPIPWTIGNIPGGIETKFPMHDDPTDPAAIDVDGMGPYFTPGDRRMCVSSGPFDFAPGDCQEIMFALVGGQSEDNISSITELKANADLTKVLYKGKFENVSRAPKSPNVTCRYFEKSIVIEWGSDHERVEEIESFDLLGYEFEGYNVYQLPYFNSKIDDAVRIATFDVVNGIKVIYDARSLDIFNGEPAEVPVAYGDDTGIQRYIRINWDHINGSALYEGTSYYFAVTAYNQNLNDDRLGARMYESTPIAFRVTLQEEIPGNKLRSNVGQGDFEIEHTGGNGEGIILVKVIDPYAITGDDYSIRFDYNHDSSDVRFSVWNETNDLMMSNGNPIIQDTLLYNGAPIVEGMEIKTISVQEGLKTVSQYDADYNLVDDKVSICNMSMGPPGYVFSNRDGACNQEPYIRDFDRFNVRGSDDIEFDFTDSSVAWQYDTNVCLREKVPFAMYRRPNGSSEKERLYIAIYDDGWRDTSVDDGLGVWDVSGVDDMFGAPVYEPIYAYVGPEPYDPAKEAAYLAANNIESAPSNTGWGVFGYDGNPSGYPIFTAGLIVDYWDNASNPDHDYIGYPEGYKVIFHTNKPLNIDDVYRFSTAGYDPVSNDSLLLAAIDRINVYPNPYYGFEGFGDDDFERKVTFTHLPERATISIFNLTGVCVNIIEHNGGQFESWYLGNYNGVRVGNGMYIAYIDMPDIGKEKILKFMIVRGTHN